MSAISVNYRRVQCKSLLNKSGIMDYAVNCYSGCAHGCVYCYARFATRFSHPGEAWGGFVDIKENAPQVLEKEVRKKTPGNVILSSVCDAWQPVEGRELLTRQCIELLTRHGFKLSTLTKNAQAARDLDLLAGNDVEFGVTVTTMDAKLAAIIEPGASPPEKRIELLQKAKSRGLKTYAFTGPLLPYIMDTEHNLTGLFKAVKEAGVNYFLVDKLNLRYGVWPDLRQFLIKHYPTLLTRYRETFFEPADKQAYRDRLKKTAQSVAVKLGIDRRMRGIY